MGVFAEIVQKLVANGIESPRLEARLLIAAAKQIKAEQVFSDIALSALQAAKLEEMLQQRINHKPLDKILGHREFYKTDFKVNEDVLSPRSDTEILVEKALQYLPKNAGNILDLGAGSGCIIESILLECNNLHGTAVDISEKSLALARQNAIDCGVAEHMDFICADWFRSDFLQNFYNKFEMIVTNPPYIPSGEIALLAPEVKNYDPLIALDGGDDGFASYRRIAELAPDLLQDGGYILLEAGYDQAEQIAEIFQLQKLTHIETAADLNGIARCVILQKAVAKPKKS